METPRKPEDQPQRTDIEAQNDTDARDIDRTVDAEQQEMSELPERDNMSLVNANLAAPINAAVALNALSDGSTAIAEANQTAPITQGIG
jgi:hypothetical protein